VINFGRRCVSGIGRWKSFSGTIESEKEGSMENTKHRLFCIVITIMLALSTFGLHAAAAQKDVVIGTHEAGSRFYVWGAGFANLITKFSKYNGKVMAVAGSGVWLPMMENGEVDLGVASFYTLWLARHGKGKYTKPYDIRLVQGGSGINIGLYVRKESPIRTRAEARGKKMGTGYAGSPNIYAYITAEIANAGLSWKDVDGIPRTTLYAGQREDVTEKRLEVFCASVGSSITRELNAAIGIRFLGLDPSPEAMAKMRKVYPVVITKVKPGAPGILEPMWLTYLPSYIVAYGKVSDTVIYDVSKAMWENHKELARIEPKLKRWTSDKFVTPQAVIPYHDGAIKFYKEKGVWTEEMEKVQKRLLAEKH